MIPHHRPLIEVFADIPDFRRPRGKRHPLSAILALACCAMWCGARSYGAIAAWGRNYGPHIARALGLRHTTPCASTLFTIFGALGPRGMCSHIGCLGGQCGGQHADSAGDARRRSGGRWQNAAGLQAARAPGAHLLSVLSHRLGLPLTQQAVDGTTNEIKAIETGLEQIVLQGRVLTMDALLTQRQVAQTIGDKGGDEVMIVQENQPHLKADIALVFPLPPTGDRQESVRTVDVGHGRVETRNLTTREAWVGSSDWPGMAQVFELGRHVITKQTGTERVEGVYGVTSVRPERATPGRLLALVRGHWQIENKSHWVRDVTFDEDRSQVRCGNIPQIMAALRNTVIGLLRWAGETNIAAACRRCAAQPAQSLALIGIEFENCMALDLHTHRGLQLDVR